jgi:hypothetical protein
MHFVNRWHIVPTVVSKITYSNADGISQIELTANKVSLVKFRKLETWSSFRAAGIQDRLHAESS